MKEEHQITNDFKLDAIKDNFKPPMMETIKEDCAKEILYRLGLSYDQFFAYVYENGEYMTDNGQKEFWAKDVANFIKKVV